MRLISALLAGLALLPGGCSVFMARSGQDLGPLATRDQVQHEFGPPAATKTTADGHAYEDYRTRRKVSELVRSYSMGMGTAMTFGLIEVVAFPAELYRNGRRLLIGQTVRFEYDPVGNVSRVYLNGDFLSFTRSQAAPETVPEPK